MFSRLGIVNATQRVESVMLLGRVWSEPEC